MHLAHHRTDLGALLHHVVELFHLHQEEIGMFQVAGDPAAPLALHQDLDGPVR